MTSSTLLLLYLHLTLLTSFRIEHSPIPDLHSHFVSDSELREVAAALDNGVKTKNVEMVELLETEDPDYISLSLQSKTKQLNLRIVQNHNFIKPNAKLKTINGNFEHEDEISPILKTSFYQGYVDDEHRGSVALARTTRGWSGLIETRQDKYIMHKVPELDSKYLLMKMIPEDFMDQKPDYITNERLSPKNVSYRTGDETFLRNLKNEFELEVGAYADAALYKLVEKRFPSEPANYKIQEIMLINLNTVHVFFQKPSIGNRISIVVSQMTVMKPTQHKVEKNREVRKYIDDFCKWNMKQNPLGRHYDIGVLFTGYELYDTNKTQVGVAGMASQSGTCKHHSPNSCALSQATSFLSALILTHEIGHNLGMFHDSQGNTCKYNTYVMGPGIVAGITDFSQCSRNFLKKYIEELDDFGINCLRNKGYSPIKHTKEGLFPGQRVPKGDQCRLIFQDGYTENTNKPNFCKNIACQRGYYTIQASQPPLPGTPCGYNKICYEGICQTKEQVNRIIAKYRPTKSGLSGRKLSLNKLCEKYVPGYSVGVDYNWNRKNGFKYDLSNICSEAMVCYNRKSGRVGTNWEPAPSGTKCGPRKVCNYYRCG